MRGFISDSLNTKEPKIRVLLLGTEIIEFGSKNAERMKKNKGLL